MKILKLTLFLVLEFVMNLCYSQANLSGELAFNVGILQSNILKKPFNLDLKSDGDLNIISQKHITIPEMNFVYFFITKNNKIYPIAGIGYTSIGFLEKGNCIINDTLYNYYYRFKNSYTNFFAGASYKLYYSTKTNIRIAQTLNLMHNINNFNNIKKNAFAERTQLIFDHKLASNFVLFFSVFAQVGLTKFNKNEIDNKGEKLLPYSYGFNIGTFFKTSNKDNN